MPDFITCSEVLHLNSEQAGESETPGVWLLAQVHGTNPGGRLIFPEQVIGGQLLVVTAQFKRWTANGLCIQYKVFSQRPYKLALYDSYL